MFDITQHQDIILHLHNISFIHKLTPKKDWIQILCPYCDDKTRHNNINHGHFYISRFFNFGKCFRCDVKTSIKDLLIYTGFNNISLLKSIFRTNSNYKFYSESDVQSYIFDVKHIINSFDKEKLNIFEKYIEKRILNIDYSKFGIFPSYEKNNILCNFNNYYKEFSAARVINSNNPKLRYIKKENSKMYFFQNPFDYSNITIAEGPFDIINLHNFSTRFNNSCYFAINGKNYLSSTVKIISDYYLTNPKLKLNIVLDSDISYTDILKRNFSSKLNSINNNTKIKFFKPTKSKDISDILMFEEV